MIEIIPSLPAKSFEELKTKIGRVRGLVSSFQIDICDGKFVSSTTWPMHDEDQARFRRMVEGKEMLPHAKDFVFELDMMVHRPELLLNDWIRVGIVRALIHIEAEHDWDACRRAAEGKIELGIALSIGTPIERIEAYRSAISVIQFMGIATIGIQGQPFDPRVLDSIREARTRFPELVIEVDGAVNAKTAPLLIEAGATRLAPGSFVLNSENPADAIHMLQTAGRV